MHKYVEVFLEIKEKITTGHWFSGMLLPTEFELCKEFNVSRITIRRALTDLEEQHFIEKIQGKGTFVTNYKNNRAEAIKGLGFQDRLSYSGLRVKTHLLEKELILANNDIKNALHLRLTKDIYVWRFKRIRFVSNYKVVLSTSFVVKEIGDKMVNLDLENKSFFNLFAEITGYRVKDSIGTVTAISIDKESSKLLNVEENSAHLFHECVSYLENDMPIEKSYSIYNSKFYKFTANMTNLMPVTYLA